MYKLLDIVISQSFQEKALYDVIGYNLMSKLIRSLIKIMMYPFHSSY